MGFTIPPYHKEEMSEAALQDSEAGLSALAKPTGCLARRHPRPALEPLSDEAHHSLGQTQPTLSLLEVLSQGFPFS